MSDNLDKQTIDWHSGFYAAACFVLNDEPYELLKEYELNKQPIRIDVLIKSKDDFTSSKDVAKIFRRVNVVEYKNPTDSLNYIQYYKTVSYACLYIGNSTLKDKVMPRDITVSIFRDRYPKKLFKQLIRNGCTVKLYKPGIYYVEGKVLFPTQVVVISQLKGDEYLAFKSLSDLFSAEDALKFVDIAKKKRNSANQEYIDAILHVSINVNKDLYDDLRRRNQYMCPALKELLKEEIQEEIDKAIADKDAKLADKDAKLADQDAKLAKSAEDMNALRAQLLAAGIKPAV